MCVCGRGGGGGGGRGMNYVLMCVCVGGNKLLCVCVCGEGETKMKLIHACVWVGDQEINTWVWKRGGHHFRVIIVVWIAYVYTIKSSHNIT